MNCRTSFTHAQTPARLSILSSPAACGSPPWMTGTRTPPAHLFRDAGSDDEFSMPLLSLKNLLSHLSSPSTAQCATGLTSSRTPANTASAHSRALSPSVAPTPRGPGPWTCSHCGEDLHLRSLLHQCHGLSPSPIHHRHTHLLILLSTQNIMHPHPSPRRAPRRS